MPLSSDGAVLDAAFHPDAVAVVGVPRGQKAGRLFLEALLDPGFKGRLYAVNPNAAEILGVPCYPSVEALPETVDFAVVVVPSESAIEVVRSCANRGVKVAALFTAGFSERGDDQGLDRERELLAAARSGGLRLIGPNCMGVYCPEAGLAMFPGMPAESGGLGFISQSGSLCSLVVRAAADRGLRFSKVVSVGNQSDLQLADYLEYLGDDPATEVIGGYVEGVRDGRRFASVLASVARKKPVVLWKSGRTASGARAARSHTGSLAGPYAVWQGLLRQTGAIGVRNQDELIDTLVALSLLRRPLGPGVAMVTGPGGPAVSASDACEEAGLVLAQLDPDTERRLREHMAAAGTSVRNPIDVGLVPGGAAQAYQTVAAIAGRDPAVDALLVVGGSREGSKAFFGMLSQLSKDLGKPVLLSWLSGQPEPMATRALAAAGIAAFAGPERALQAYARAWDYSTFRTEVEQVSR